MDSPAEVPPLELLRAWWHLPRSTRSEVLRLSRRGERHPDLHIAWIAWHWARTVLPVGAPEPGHWRNILLAAGWFSYIALNFVSAHSEPDPPTPGWLQRRQARRVLRLGPPV